MFEQTKAAKRRSTIGAAIGEESPFKTQYFVGNGIDIGAGNDPLSKNVHLFGFITKVLPWDLQNGDAQYLSTEADQSFDFVHSSHCLEHMVDPEVALAHWARVCRTQGYLVITIPDEVLYEQNVWPSRFNNDHKWSFTLRDTTVMPRSIHVPTMLAKFPHLEIVSMHLLDEGYDYSLKGRDQTISVDGPECAIELVLRKIAHVPVGALQQEANSVNDIDTKVNTADKVDKFKKVIPIQSVAMEPIRNPDTVTSRGLSLVNLTLDPYCFFLNSLAMGDLIATAPVVKWMIENYYTTPGSYLVVAKKMYRSLFPFVPDENFRNFDTKDAYDHLLPEGDVNRGWGIPATFCVGRLNKPKVEMDTRFTPKKVHLAQFAALIFNDQPMAPATIPYVPLVEVDVSRFGVDWSKSVVLIVSYRDLTRAWHSEYVLGVAEWLKSKGFTPVFIGRTEMNENHSRDSIKPKTSLPDDVSAYGVDLRNQTSIEELASIFRHVRAVCGIDSGPIHLAGTTSVPIVCGYTSVSAALRIPYRKEGKTYPVVPPIPCIGCESRWRSNFWNWENCYLGHIDCCTNMVPERFIIPLREILDVKD